MLKCAFSANIDRENPDYITPEGIFPHGSAADQDVIHLDKVTMLDLG